MGSRNVGALEPCMVDCSHYGTMLGNKADDPFHCDMYYVCFSKYDWSDFSFSCPDGEMFDTVSKQCKAKGYICRDICLKCTFTCDNPILNKAANSTNCRRFFTCNGAIAVPAQCPPENPYFDGSICQKDVSKCCSCKPECTEMDAINHNMIPDHSNCTNFYLCMAPGVPDSSSHGHCPSGNFNPMSGNCEEDAPCDVTCTNGPDEDGCVDLFICSEAGYFPRCTKICDPSYFWCSENAIGQEAQRLTCSHNNVIDPYVVLCVPPDMCPV